MKKIILLLVSLTIGFALLAAGCGKDKPANAALEQKVVGYGKSDQDLSKVVLTIGAAEGKNGQAMLEAAGLDKTPYKVEFHVMQGGNLVLEAMAAKQLDLGTGSQIPPIFASRSANGGNFKIIATKKSATIDQELVVGGDSAIKSVADLKGKKIAYVKNTTAHYFLAKMLETAGVDWNDVNAIPMTTSDGLSALLTGEVDALASYGNAVRAAHAKGAVTLESAQHVLSGDFYWYASPEAIADPAKHAAIVDYLSRYHEANEWARNHPQEWADYYGPKINQKPADYLKTYTEENEQALTRIVSIDDATIASEQDIVNVFAKLKLLAGGMDISKIFDHSFAAAIDNFTKYK